MDQKPVIIHDLANEVRYFQWKPDYDAKNNFKAILKYHENTEVNNIYIATGYTWDRCMYHMRKFASIVTSTGGIIVNALKNHPDRVVLKLADQLNGYPVSKDKFREYTEYESVNRRLEYDIINGKLEIMNANKFGLENWF